MYTLIDTIGTVSIIFVIVAICIGVPVFAMEKLQERTGCFNRYLKLLYGADWDKVEDFEEEED